MSIIKDFIKNFCRIASEVKNEAITEKLTTNVKRNPVQDPKDKESTNLYVGKILEDNMLKCEVLDVHKTNIHVKILDIYWGRMETYLDVGNVYPVFKHSGWNDNVIQVWEISGKRMKRNTSQVILQWEIGIGWCWDLDF